MKHLLIENKNAHRALHGFLLATTLVTVISTSVGCSQAKRFVLEADKSQLGAGARIEMVGNEGRIKMAPAPGWPKGLDKAVTLDQESELPMSALWTVKMEPNFKLDFVRSYNGWICQSCAHLQLPLEWHVAKN